MSRRILNIVNEIDNEVLKKQYEDTKHILEEVDKFIKKKKLLIYGGYALNLLLPKQKKFYKEFTINDYDCFSKNAKSDAIELANHLKDLKYEYIKVKKALHENTYKIYVDFVQILDITQISPLLYDTFMDIHNTEKKTSIYKYYKDKYTIVPFMFLISNLHYELARPSASYYRWDKIYHRLMLITDTIKVPKIAKQLYDVHHNQINNKILKYAKINNMPIVNEWALQFYISNFTKISERDHIVFLSKDIEKTKKDILKMFKNKIDVVQDTHTASIIGNYFSFIHDDGTLLCTVIDVQNDCFSVTKLKGYTIGSIDTIMYFLYRISLLNHLTTCGLWDIETQINRIHPEKRLNKNCYGIAFSLKDVLKKKWKKKLTIKYMN